MECSAPAVEWEDLAVTAEGLAAVAPAAEVENVNKLVSSLFLD